MKKLILFTLLLLSFSLFAQQKNTPAIGRLYGKIIDASKKEPIAYASVTVLRTLPNGQDSLIGGALTLENGDFNITSLPMGAFKVKVSFVGNKDLIKPVKISPPNSIEQDLGDWAMLEDAQVLSAIEVKAEKATTTMSLEKRVFNVDKNITSAGGTAEDVLKNVPSVTVDMDGNTKLRDRSATIYVDGKPTLMALNQIPSNQIESVEVITNPSAKYEASTMGGILNIVLKQNRKAGYSGVIGLDSNYALESYDLDVIDYLMKPVSMERFTKAALKALEEKQKQEALTAPPSVSEPKNQLEDAFFVNVEYSMVKISIKNISHIESMKDYVKIFLTTAKKPVITKSTLKAIEEKLSPQIFMRVHKSFIVNLHKIESIRSQNITIGDHNVPISEAHLESLMRVLHQTK